MLDSSLLEQPIEKTRRISPSYLERLRKVGVFSLEDLFYYFPHRYIDFSRTVPVRTLRLGEPATVSGKVFAIANKRIWKRNLTVTEALIQDKTGFLKAVWFNQPFLVKNLKKGDEVNLAGTLGFRGKEMIFQNPDYEKITGNETRHTGRIVPIYRETKGLSSRWLRFFIQKNLESYLPLLPDFLPPQILNRNFLLDLPSAIRQIHFPDNRALLEKAKKRLAFEEVFLLQIFSFLQKVSLKKISAPAIPFDLELIKNFTASLPFRLTKAQKRSAWEILKDIQKKHPMNRLLEGDVGSGKTVVAAMAMLQTAAAGYQAVLMAPTEILARQHFLEIRKLLVKKPVKIAFLTSQKAQLNRRVSPKKTVVEKIKKGEIDLVIGTHALIQKEVCFDKLALTIVDEQHRFGVEQRAALQKKTGSFDTDQDLCLNAPLDAAQDASAGAHFLSMTATPIPRTLALTVYGNLDISLLDEMPKDRKRVKTFIVPPEKRNGAYDFIRREIKEGHRVFVVCPRIEKPADLETTSDRRKTLWENVKTVKEEQERLQKKIFPEFKVGLIHGQLKSAEKEKTMKAFKDGKIQILVSTSVIEVGVDIPDATIMVIEDADRFGLAQLHQFRGRVGRGQAQSFCFLFAENPQPDSLKRLKALTAAKNGFELAELDLKLRGPGEFFGTEQSGLSEITMTSLSDMNLVKKSRQEALIVVKKDPELKSFPAIKRKVARFGKNVHAE